MQTRRRVNRHPHLKTAFPKKPDAFAKKPSFFLTGRFVMRLYAGLAKPKPAHI
jgi:hypothetical protein